MLRRGLIALVAVFAATSALAQSTYPTPGGRAFGTAQLGVAGCLNGSNQAVPCSVTNPLSVTGTITATIPTGPAGTANVNVLSVQGIAAMTPLLVTLGAETTKVIGTVNQGTSPWVVSGPLTDAELRATAVPVSGTFWQATQPVSGTVTASAPVGITPTDRTIASTSGSSQTLMSANASRRQLVIMNTGSANCGVNPTGGTAAIGGAGTLTLVPNGSYTPPIPTLSAVTVICTAGQPIYAEESWQ